VSAGGKAPPAASLRLYKKVPCLFCQRVRITFAEKDLSVEEVAIDAVNKPDWFLALSPFGKIPLLAHGGILVFESAVIMEYLEEVFPGRPLLPPDPAARAHIRVWIDFANTRLHPAFMALLAATPTTFPAHARAFESCLEMLESTLARVGSPGPYFAGAVFTLADAAYAPSFERFEVLPELKGYRVPDALARVRRLASALAERSSVRACAETLEANVRNCRRYVPQ